MQTLRFLLLSFITLTIISNAQTTSFSIYPPIITQPDLQ